MAGILSIEETRKILQSVDLPGEFAKVTTADLIAAELIGWHEKVINEMWK